MKKTLTTIALAGLIFNSCGKEIPVSPQINQDIEISKKIEVYQKTPLEKKLDELGDRLSGINILNLEIPVEYNDGLIERVADYCIKHKDLGVFPIVEGGRIENGRFIESEQNEGIWSVPEPKRIVTGFGLYGIRRGVGYSGMIEDILNLAK